jgi:hypothetical protein
MPRRALALLVLAIGLVLLAVAIVYFAVPAKSLPSFIPGHVRGVSAHRVKRATAAAVLGLASLVLAYLLAAGAAGSGRRTG